VRGQSACRGCLKLCGVNHCCYRILFLKQVADAHRMQVASF
jgi:hypothetical protein